MAATPGVNRSEPPADDTGRLDGDPPAELFTGTLLLHAFQGFEQFDNNLLFSSPDVIGRSLGPGELFAVPRGVEHQTYADEETSLLLIEPTGTPNTGDVRTAAPRQEL